jgi:hypothetical protein
VRLEIASRLACAIGVVMQAVTSIRLSTTGLLPDTSILGCEAIRSSWDVVSHRAALRCLSVEA